MSCVVPRFSAPDSSHVTLSASRPFLADHMSLPITATPRGICTTSITPATALALVASNELTLPPKRGGRMTTAVIMPGSMTSMANCCLPVDLARASSRGSFSLPTMLKAAGSLRLTCVGTGSFAALPASSPKVALRPAPVCDTTPWLTLISLAGTAHALAAAATSMARAVAPAWRSCCQELATAVEPPVSWILPPIARLPYTGTCAGALSTRIWSQDASSSSATIAGSPVQTPWPASRCLEITVTVLSGAMRTNGMTSGPAAAPPAPPGPVPHPGSTMPRVSPEPASVVSFRKSRRVSSQAATAVAGAAASSVWRKYMVHLLTRGEDAGRQSFGRLMDGAAADVAGHRGVDVGVRRPRVRGEQRRRRHDLPALAIAALGDVERDPRLLHRVTGGRREPFDGRDLPALCRRDRRHARARRLAVDVHGTGAAQRHAAAELGAGELQVIAEGPEERHVRIDVQLAGVTVHGQFDGHVNDLRVRGEKAKGKFFARLRRLRHPSFERPAAARRRLAHPASLVHCGMKKAGFRAQAGPCHRCRAGSPRCQCASEAVAAVQPDGARRIGQVAHARTAAALV